VYNGVTVETRQPRSRVFLISDTHFGHENIIRYCSRPFSSAEEMDRVLIRNWNEAVGPEDVVIHLGDFALGSPGRIREYLEALNGEIFFLRGNHDTLLEMVVGPLPPHMVIPLAPPSLDLRLQHYPGTPSPGEVVIHGHIHDKAPLFDPRIHRMNVSVEATGYKPVLVKEIIELVRGPSQHL